MTFKFECPHCGQHIRAECGDAGTEGVCPACNATFRVPDLVTGEGPSAEEAPESATDRVPNDTTAACSPASTRPGWKAILPMVLMMALLGWLPLFAMHGIRWIDASSGATFVFTGLCASFATAAFFYWWLRPRAVSRVAALLVFFATAIAGVFLLLAFQRYAAFMLARGSIYAGKSTVWLWIIQFAGTCYEWTYTSKNLFKQVVGFVFGVGVYEELTKILVLPVF